MSFSQLLDRVSADGELDGRYQGMRGRASEEDPVPWDCEKHVRDAVADEW